MTSIALVLNLAMLMGGAEEPLTRPERTEYRETSLHADVMGFLYELQRHGMAFPIEIIGQSTEGRELPLVIASIPPIREPHEARRAGKPVVYLQANIHGGEVEGKEAVQEILRDWTFGRGRDILERVIVLVQPIYNPDGNDALGPQSRNRGSQNGPEQIGLRPNGQGFDLNRDAMKADSPEMRATLDRVYNRWDPDVIIDLHATNGTRHGYPITYAPPLHPDTDPGVLVYSREELPPTVRQRLRERHGLETFDYGNLARGAAGGPAWSTFSHEGRFITNYAGLRGRIGVLVEALSYCPFEERIRTTKQFVEAVLEKVAEDAEKVLRLTRAADERMAQLESDRPLMGLRFELESRGEEQVLVERPRPAGSPRTLEKPTDLESLNARILSRFRAIETAQLPIAYAFPAHLTEARDLLVRHGITVERFAEDWTGEVDSFRVTQIEEARTPFQGRRAKTLHVTREPKTITLTTDSYLVRTNQPLGTLLFHLAEPRSQDGLANWGFLDANLQEGEFYPIYRLLAIPGAATHRVARSEVN